MFDIDDITSMFAKISIENINTSRNLQLARYLDLINFEKKFIF